MIHGTCNTRPDHMPRDDGWVSANLATAILTLARTGRPFTADDLWGDHFGFGPSPDSEGKLSNVKPQEVGQAFRTAARKNIIRLIGYRPSTRKGRRGGLVRVWIAGWAAYQ